MHWSNDMHQSHSNSQARSFNGKSDFVASGQITGCVYLLPIVLIFYTCTLCTVSYIIYLIPIVLIF